MDDSRLLEDYLIRSRWLNRLQMATFGLIRVLTSDCLDTNPQPAIHSWCLDAYFSDDPGQRTRVLSPFPLERLSAARVPQTRHCPTRSYEYDYYTNNTFRNCPKMLRKISERLNFIGAERTELMRMSSLLEYSQVLCNFYRSLLDINEISFRGNFQILGRTWSRERKTPLSTKLFLIFGSFSVKITRAR